MPELPSSPAPEERPEVPARRFAHAIDDVVAVVEGRPGPPGPFDSPSYRRLFIGMVSSSLGDWVGLFAITAYAIEVGKSAPGAAVGVVLSARLLPGLFLGSFASAFLDRWDRKKVMISCDIGRGLVMASLPFMHSIAGLFLASVVMELLTLMWTPAKEASVPNLVPTEALAAANSYSLAAAYGTFVPAALVSAGLSSLAAALAHVHVLRFFRLGQESLAMYFDVLSFFVSAALISTLVLPAIARRSNGVGADGEPLGALRQVLADSREGWRFIGASPVVRAVVIGISTGLIGGGMLIPLGAIFSKDVLHSAGGATFSLFEFALGAGVGIGILGLSVLQRRVSHERVFTLAVFGAGAGIIAAASTSQLAATMVFISGVGVCAGAVYVLGFTMLQTNVDDTLRGRIFGLFYTLVRLCLLMALVLSPLLSGLLDRLSGVHHNRRIHLGSWSVAMPPGVRLTLWLGGVIILAAGTFAQRSLRSAPALANGSGNGGDQPNDGTGS